MREIRQGLEDGLDVSSYCGLIYSATDMKEKRLGLLREKTTKPNKSNGKESILNSLVTKEDIYDDLDRREIVLGLIMKRFPN